MSRPLSSTTSRRISRAISEISFYGTVTRASGDCEVAEYPYGETCRNERHIGSVLDLAKRAGLNMERRATPAIALGAADATPIEVAGAYTMFANRGIVSKPNWIRMIRSNKGAPHFRSAAAA